jgi:hypothetical protein
MSARSRSSASTARPSARTTTPTRPKSPCWYFNQGGCNKSDSECIYAHVIDKTMRKPINLQHPCPFWHHKTPLTCRFGDKCKGDHFYELTASEWKKSFADIQYPGEGYFEAYKAAFTQKATPVQKVQTPFVKAESDFPVLASQPAHKNTVGVWNKPLTFNEPPKSTDFKAPLKTQQAPLKMKKESRKHDPSASWADWSDSEDEEDEEVGNGTPSYIGWEVDSPAYSNTGSTFAKRIQIVTCDDE